ncbi:TetR/AcrR family transcriptional regulator [Streptomyces bambusae]|uniref:TetR/AcrR family transcriptional regulator n=1 Tax=Streptomyces bambusae TaxID=1550616 RepID=UPI001CFE7151|nr:TetR/AcrR family transcriptional regulator [Streptomyces bambusae]MCB5167721.1 TetR/AcrR family transcriptional regulator [Streptomyces bambusae]
MSPLPRFHRLPAERRSAILAAARAQFAAHGPEAASYNKIIEAARISKTAAYQYFDGREDLLAAVLDDVLERLLGVLGPWTPAAGEKEFWAQLEAGTAALAAHLDSHPDDLALADPAARRAAGAAAWTGWYETLVRDGQRLGVIRTDIEPPLLAAATAAVLRAADTWALAALRDGGSPDTGQVWRLLRGLWTSTD